MRTTALPIGLGLFVLFVTGCTAVTGSGISMTERRTVAEYDQIELRGIGTVEITAGELSELEVSGDDNVVPLIRTDVVDRRLVIRTEKEVRPVAPLVIRGATPDVVAASCSGAGDIRISGVQNESKVRLIISGAGNLTFSGSVGGLHAAVSGAGDIRLAGTANTAEFVVSGAGDIQAADLQAKRVKARVSGAGDVTLNAGEALDASVSGAGDIRYTGDAKEISQKVSGVGSIQRMK